MCVCVQLAEEEKDFKCERINDWHPVKVFNPKQQEYIMQWIKRGNVAIENGVVYSQSLFCIQFICVLYHLSIVIEYW